jgi:ABC-type proline/glycine betaine transport system permease subunit
VGDKIPAVDHVLHAIGNVIAPVSGAALFTGQTGAETDLPTIAAILLGGATAESIHAGRATIRPLSTAATGGLGNPVLSALEDLGSLGLMLAAFIVPVLALLAAIALAVLIVVAWRRRRRPG